jgi:hypothetical protein
MSNMNDWNRQTIEAFRANEGQVGGFWEGRPLLLLLSSLCSFLNCKPRCRALLAHPLRKLSWFISSLLCSLAKQLEACRARPVGYGY